MTLNLSLLILLLSQMLLLSGVVYAQQSKAADSKMSRFTQEHKILPPGFVSDGCTMWFNADYKDCCVQHDLDYFNTGNRWRGRFRADNRLFLCVAGKNGSWHLLVAPVMWSGVRIFGSDWLPLSNKNVVHKFMRRATRYLVSKSNR